MELFHDFMALPWGVQYLLGVLFHFTIIGYPLISDVIVINPTNESILKATTLSALFALFFPALWVFGLMFAMRISASALKKARS